MPLSQLCLHPLIFTIAKSSVGRPFFWLGIYCVILVSNHDHNFIAFFVSFLDIKGSSRFSTGEVDAVKVRIFQKTETYIGFTFLVHHSIVIHSLHLLRDFVTAYDGFVQVSLINSVTRERIVSATFSNNGNNSGPNLLEKTVEPHILPKGFEGHVIMKPIGKKSGKASLNHSQCWLRWNNASGLITFLQLIRNINEKPVPFHYMSCTYACLTFTLHGKLLGHLSRDFL
jgi:hypothetical protein